jgi:hypothetical protein
MPSRPQRRHQQAPVGLQRDVHRGELAAGVLGQQAAQPSEPSQIVTDPGGDQHPAGRIDQGDVVMAFGPVDPTKDSHWRISSFRRFDLTRRAAEGRAAP